jgi:L-aspartate oxidase
MRHGPSPELLELRSLACVASLVARSALLRHESRGAHYNADHPGSDPAAVDTVLGPGQRAPNRHRRAVA